MKPLKPNGLSVGFMEGFKVGFATTSKEVVEDATKAYMNSDYPHYYVGILEGYEAGRKVRMQQGWEEDITIDK